MAAVRAAVMEAATGSIVASTSTATANDHPPKTGYAAMLSRVADKVIIIIISSSSSSICTAFAYVEDCFPSPTNHVSPVP